MPPNNGFIGLDKVRSPKVGGDTAFGSKVTAGNQILSREGMLMENQLAAPVKNIPTTLPTPIPPLPEPTAYARIYGTEEQRLDHLRGTGRSGMTPLGLDVAVAGFSAEKRACLRLEEQLQRNVNSGWTSHHLSMLGAIDKPHVLPNNLTNEIHPLLQRSQWKSESKWQIGGGIPGSWTASNDTVWHLMQPILRLATQFLMNTHSYAWWDALLWGKSEKMPEPPAPPFASNLQRFLLRPVHERFGKDKFADSQYLETFRHEISFSFTSGDLDSVVATNLTIDADRPCFHGATYFGPQPDIKLAWENVDPLLRSDMTEGRKLLTQFFIAKTVRRMAESKQQADVLRSFMNFVMQYVSFSMEPKVDEVLLEVGRSFENAVFGGRVEFLPMLRSGWGRRNILAAVTHDWPTLFDWENTPQVEKDEGPSSRTLSCESTSWAISIAHIEALQQQAYWDNHVSTYGAHSIRPYPRLVGMRKRLVSIFGSRTIDETVYDGDFRAYHNAVDNDVWKLPRDTTAQKIELARIIDARWKAIGLGVGMI